MIMGQVQLWLYGIMDALFPTNIWNIEYFAGLWKRYASIGGFFTGVVVIIMLYHSSEDTRKRGVLRTFALVALINGLDGAYIIIMNFVNNYILKQASSIYETYIQGAFNPLSIAILVLIITECYRNKGKLAFFFGLSTFSVSILIFGSGYTNEGVLPFLFVRVLLAALICVLGSKMVYSFVFHLLMGIFFLVTEATQTYILSYELDTINKSIRYWFEIFFAYRAEMVIIGGIVLIFALYEVFVLSENKIKVRELSIVKSVLSILLISTISGGFVYTTVNAANKMSRYNNASGVNQQNTYSYEPVQVTSAQASSFLTGKSGSKYDIDYTLDDSIETCWQHGGDNDGTGESLKYNFGETVLLAKIFVINGNMKSEAKYYENNRVMQAKIMFYKEDNLVGEEIIVFEDNYGNQPNRFVFDEFKECDSVVMVIERVYEGNRYDDLCISEVNFEEVVGE